MRDEPTCHEQSDRQKYGDDGEPVLSRPPEREQEADAKDNTSHFTSNDIEAGKNQQSANDRRSQISGRKSDSADTALHVRDSALMGIQRDGLDPASCATCGDGMAELVESNDQHL